MVSSFPQGEREGRGAWAVVRFTAWMRSQKFVRLKSRLVTRFSRRVEPTKMLFYFTRYCSIVTSCTDDVTLYTNGVTPSGTIVLTIAPAPRSLDWYLSDDPISSYRETANILVTPCINCPKIVGTRDVELSGP